MLVGTGLRGIDCTDTLRLVGASGRDDASAMPSPFVDRRLKLRAISSSSSSSSTTVGGGLRSTAVTSLPKRVYPGRRGLWGGEIAIGVKPSELEVLLKPSDGSAGVCVVSGGSGVESSFINGRRSAISSTTVKAGLCRLRFQPCSDSDDHSLPCGEFSD